MPILSLLSRERKTDKIKTVIITQRNVIGCQAIAEYRDKGDVISVWGGAHIPGMLHLLTQMGYEVIDTKWHGVIDANSYSLPRALRDISRAAQKKPEAGERSEKAKKTTVDEASH